MAKPTTKRAPKPPSTLQPSIPPRYPFTSPSPPLAAYLSTLPQQHIYILHIDPYPPPHKRRIFAVPLILNICLAALLLWRLRAAAPAYMRILGDTLGLDGGAKKNNIDVQGASWAALAELGVRRAAMFFGDFALARVVLGWPWDFFYWGEPPGPARWRWVMGFEDREVVVRRSRRWGEEMVVGGDETVRGEGEKGGEVYRERILPAVERGWVRGRTGYAMMDRSWDLYFKGMMDAHRLLAQGKIRLEDFERKVAVFTRGEGWRVWEVGKLEAGAEDAGREKIERVKNGLTALGKEGLFFRWVELVQFETAGQEGPLTEVRRGEIMRKGKELFHAQGVDFDGFWSGVGGVEVMPGMGMADGQKLTGV